MNLVTLTGTVTRDFTIYKSGKMAYGTLAVNPVYGEIGWNKDRDKCQASFVPVRILGEKQAQNAEKYLLKGTKILIKGNLVYTSKKDENGNYHDSCYVVVNNYEFVGGKKEQSSGNNSNAEDLDGFMQVGGGSNGEVPFS